MTIFKNMVVTEINNAIAALSIPNDDINLLGKKETEIIYLKCLDHFVKSGDRQWWWEDFKSESFSIHSLENPFSILNEIMPNLSENVWFITEDCQEEFYPVFDCKPKIIKDIIGECFGFEYYIIAKDFSWLICENHHSRLIGVGDFSKNDAYKKYLE